MVPSVLCWIYNDRNGYNDKILILVHGVTGWRLFCRIYNDNDRCGYNGKILVLVSRVGDFSVGCTMTKFYMADSKAGTFGDSNP